MVEIACFIRVEIHRVTVSRHQPVCKMRGLLSVFFFFDPDVLYSLENENDPLASMDISHPVRNSANINTVIESEVSEGVSLRAEIPLILKIFAQRVTRSYS